MAMKIGYIMVYDLEMNQHLTENSCSERRHLHAALQAKATECKRINYYDKRCL